MARGYTASGLEVTLTPHAGIGVGDRGGTAEAGEAYRRALTLVHDDAERRLLERKVAELG